MPLVTRSTNASMALTKARGVGDGLAEAGADGTADDAVWPDEFAVGAGRQPLTTAAASTPAEIARHHETRDPDIGQTVAVPFDTHRGADGPAVARTFEPRLSVLDHAARTHARYARGCDPRGGARDPYRSGTDQ